MSNLLILLGGKEGPWCSLTRFTRPAVRVSGLPEDAKVLIEARSDHGFGILAEIDRNGQWPLAKYLPVGELSYLGAKFDWIRAACDKPDKGMICVVTQAARVAPEPWSVAEVS